METGDTGFSGEVEGVVVSAAAKDADDVLPNALRVVTEVPSPNAELCCFSEVVSEVAVAQTGFASFERDAMVPNALGPVFAKVPKPPPPPNVPAVTDFMGATGGAFDCPNDDCPNTDWPREGCPNVVFPKTLPPVEDWFDWAKPPNAPPAGTDAVADEVSAVFEDEKVFAPELSPNALGVLLVLSCGFS